MVQLVVLDAALPGQLARLGTRLTAATQQQDWSAVQALDAELAQVLSRLPSAEAWSPDLAQAMTSLRQAHTQALMQCAMASEDMAARMSTTLNSKEGWMAYAANSDWTGRNA